MLPEITFALGSVVFAEMVRDAYHLAGHYWKPLQPWHNLHHKVFSANLEILNADLYRRAELHNDVPEALAMLVATLTIALTINHGLGRVWGHLGGLWLGCVYSVSFLLTSLARSQGWWLATDLTHKPGEFTETPSIWLVNRTYHWRHHFDQGRAYFSGTFTLMDKLLGTCLSLKGKVVAVTGASGTMGQALLAELAKQGAKPIALTTTDLNSFPEAGQTEVILWRLGEELQHQELLKKVDILIINHGVNVYGDRSPEAIQKSWEVNAFSGWRWLEAFLATVTTSRDRALKEVWINTSEAEVNPAFSPLYEISKRLIGDMITLRRLDAPCIVRKLVLGPFKSSLNPYGIMSAKWVAWAIVTLAKRDFRNIVITINPFTYIFFPIKETLQSLYFRLFSQKIN